MTRWMSQMSRGNNFPSKLDLVPIRQKVPQFWVAHWSRPETGFSRRLVVSQMSSSPPEASVRPAVRRRVDDVYCE